MAKNYDGTVTLRTLGKVATTPSGSGTGAVRNPAFRAAPSTGAYVQKQPGRTVVAKSARGA